MPQASHPRRNVTRFGQLHRKQEEDAMKSVMIAAVSTTTAVSTAKQPEMNSQPEMDSRASEREVARLVGLAMAGSFVLVMVLYSLVL
jgi:hypothetical protein